MTEATPHGDDFEHYERAHDARVDPALQPHGGDDGEHDEEHHRREREKAHNTAGVNIITHGIAVILSLVVGWLFRADLEYYVSDPNPVDIGDAREKSLLDAWLPHGAYVRVTGLPDPRRAIAPNRDGGETQYFLLMNSWIFVHRIVPPNTPSAVHDEYEPYTATGRLMQIEREPRFAEVKRYMAKTLGYKMPDRTWLLFDGQAPRAGWSIPSMYGVLLLLIAFNGWRFVRALRARAALQRK